MSKHCPHCGAVLAIEPHLKLKALQMYANGLSMREISRQLEGKISYATVSRIVRNAIKEKQTVEKILREAENE